MNEYRLYQFKTKIKVGSMNDVVLNFFKENAEELSERERILQAALGHWLPLALLHSGNFTEKEIALCGLATIQKLRQQINYLSLVLSLQLPSYSDVFAANLSQSIPANGRVNGIGGNIGNGKDNGNGSDNGNYHHESGKQAQQQKITPYPELDGLDTPPPSKEDITEEDLTVNLQNFDELAFSADTEMINKMFGI